MSREHSRVLQIVQETLSQGFTTTLSSMLRAVTHVGIKDIVQRPYHEYINVAPNPTLLTMLALGPEGATALLQIPLRVAYTATEMMLGGRGGPDQPERAMTEFELALMRTIVDQLLPVVTVAFEPLLAVEPSIAGQESNPQFAQFSAPTDMMIIISFDLKIEGVSEEMTLCIPHGVLQPHLEAVSARARAGALSADKIAQERARLQHHLVEANVRAAAKFRPALASSRQIITLTVGDTLLLNHPVGMPLTLEVDGIAVHDVRIGRINRHLAVQVADSVDPSQVRRPARLQVAPASEPPA